MFFIMLFSRSFVSSDNVSSAKRHADDLKKHDKIMLLFSFEIEIDF